MIELHSFVNVIEDNAMTMVVVWSLCHLPHSISGIKQVHEKGMTKNNITATVLVIVQLQKLFFALMREP